jgi:hypothetical protein
VFFGIADCPAASAGDDEQSARSAASDWQGLSRAGCQETFILEPLQRCIHSADGVLAPGAIGEITPDREAVRAFPEASDGKEGGKLESAERLGRHFSQSCRTNRVAQEPAIPSVQFGGSV